MDGQSCIRQTNPQFDSSLLENTTRLHDNLGVLLPFGDTTLDQNQSTEGQILRGFLECRSSYR